MSFWDNVHALFDEDCFQSIASRVFSDAKSSFSQNPQCLSPTCIVSCHPVPRFPGQFWRSILGFGTVFSLLWAHPLPMLTLRIGSVVPFGSSVVSGWPPDWSLLRGAAVSFKRYAALLCLWRYAFFFDNVQVYETFV
eukprot:205815-Chlamydomonas_euryale.AAC.1